MILKKPIIALYLIFQGLSLYAQETIPVSGGDASGSGGYVSYTVGQAAYTTNTSADGSVSQGVQLAFSISTLTQLKTNGSVNLQCATYPNPTTDYLILQVYNHELKNLSYQLYDTRGKLLETKTVESTDTSIKMSHLISGSYLLKILQNNIEIKSFKIIKK